MMDSQSPLDQETQKASDPHIYKPDEGEDDEDEIDRRIRRAGERLRRLTIVGAPEFNNDFLCEDTLTVEGGYDTGYAVNYVDCGAATPGSNSSVACGPCGGEEFDDCGGCNFVATITGVTLQFEECLASGNGQSEIMHEITPFNNDYPMWNNADPGSNPPDGCAWFDLGASFIGNIQHERYFFVEDCSGSPNQVAGAGWGISIGCVGGTWYCLITWEINPADPFLFFYGESSNPASFTNTATYTGPNAISLDNPFIEWLYGSTPKTFMGVGTGGSVTTDFGSHV